MMSSSIPGQEVVVAEDEECKKATYFWYGGRSSETQKLVSEAQRQEEQEQEMEPARRETRLQSLTSGQRSRSIKTQLSCDGGSAKKSRLNEDKENQPAERPHHMVISQKEHLRVQCEGLGAEESDGMMSRGSTIAKKQNNPFHPLSG